MSLEKTEAILLKSYNWSESSRTVIMFSRQFGRLPLIDRGGRSFKSKRGRLMPFARMEITFYASEKESSGYVSSVDLIKAWTFEGDGMLGRLAFGSAGCELLNLLLPEEEPLPNFYDYFVTFLEYVEAVDKRSLAGVFLAFFLHLLSQLGYRPALDNCAACSKPLAIPSTSDAGQILFGVERGGVVCSTCQSPADYYIPLSVECFEPLVALQTASLREAAAISVSFGQASRIMEVLTKLVSHQAGVKGDLKSLDFLEKLRNSNLSE
jgi:DNA repair protein RecO (recombination protein O)